MNNDITRAQHLAELNNQIQEGFSRDYYIAWRQAEGEIERLKAQIPEWLPISEARRDETEMLLYTKEKQALEGYWSLDNKEWTVLIYEGDEPIQSFKVEPTHYQEIPEPPREEID